MGTRKIRICIRKENIYKGKIAVFRNVINSHDCQGCTFYNRSSGYCTHSPAPCEDYKRKDNKNVKFIKIK